MTWTSVLIGMTLLGGNGYPRGDLLIEPEALAKERFEVRIVDARPMEKYKAAHIAGAVWVDHDAWAKAFADGQNPKDWAERIGKLGIDSPKTRVVIYDDNLSKDAARIWWILRYWGVKDVRLLNGGWPGWIAAKRFVSKAGRQVAATTYAIPQAADNRL